MTVKRKKKKERSELDRKLPEWEEEWKSEEEEEVEFDENLVRERGYI